MNSFASEVELLETIVQESTTLEQYLDKAITFLVTRALEDYEREELNRLSDSMLNSCRIQKAKAEKLLDAISYYSEQSERIRTRQAQIWYEILALRSENQDLEEKLQICREFESRQNEDPAEYFDGAKAYEVEPDNDRGETLCDTNDDRTLKKRRRSAGRVVIDGIKKLAHKKL